MRCLGIPNTAHFANVTQIEDALACKNSFYKIFIMTSNKKINMKKLYLFEHVTILFYLTVWDKLKGQKTAERWQPEAEEEFEDSMGNVVNKKTYEDLKRQGLL